MDQPPPVHPVNPGILGLGSHVHGPGMDHGPLLVPLLPRGAGARVVLPPTVVEPPVPDWRTYGVPLLPRQAQGEPTVLVSIQPALQGPRYMLGNGPSHVMPPAPRGSQQALPGQPVLGQAPGVRDQDSVGLTPALMKLLYVAPLYVRILLDVQRALRANHAPQSDAEEAPDVLAGLWVAVRTPSGAPVLRPIFSTHTPYLLPALPSSAGQPSQEALPVGDTVQVHLRPPVHVPVSQLVDLQGSGANEIDLLCELSAWWLTCNKPPPTRMEVSQQTHRLLHALRAYNCGPETLSISTCPTPAMFALLLYVSYGELATDSAPEPQLTQAVKVLPAWDQQLQLQAVGRWAAAGRPNMPASGSGAQELTARSVSVPDQRQRSRSPQAQGAARKERQRHSSKSPSTKQRHSEADNRHGRSRSGKGEDASGGRRRSHSPDISPARKGNDARRRRSRSPVRDASRGARRRHSRSPPSSGRHRRSVSPRGRDDHKDAKRLRKRSVTPKGRTRDPPRESGSKPAAAEVFVLRRGGQGGHKSRSRSPPVRTTEAHGVASESASGGIKPAHHSSDRPAVLQVDLTAPRKKGQLDRTGASEDVITIPDSPPLPIPPPPPPEPPTTVLEYSHVNETVPPPPPPPLPYPAPPLPSASPEPHLHTLRPWPPPQPLPPPSLPTSQTILPLPIADNQPASHPPFNMPPMPPWQPHTIPPPPPLLDIMLPPHLRAPAPPVPLVLEELPAVPLVRLVGDAGSGPAADTTTHPDEAHPAMPPILPGPAVAEVVGFLAAEGLMSSGSGAAPESAPPPVPPAPVPSAHPDHLTVKELMEFREPRIGEAEAHGALRWCQATIINRLQELRPAGLLLRELEPGGSLPLPEQVVRRLGSSEAVVRCPRSKPFFSLTGDAVFLKPGYCKHVRTHNKTIVAPPAPPATAPAQAAPAGVTASLIPNGPAQIPGHSEPGAAALRGSASEPLQPAGAGNMAQQRSMANGSAASAPHWARSSPEPTGAQPAVAPSVPHTPIPGEGHPGTKTHLLPLAPMHSGPYNKRPMPSYCDQLCPFLNQRPRKQATRAELLKACPYPRHAFIAAERFFEINRDLFDVVEDEASPGVFVFRLTEAGVKRAHELEEQNGAPPGQAAQHNGPRESSPVPSNAPTQHAGTEQLTQPAVAVTGRATSQEPASDAAQETSAGAYRDVRGRPWQPRHPHREMDRGTYAFNYVTRGGQGPLLGLHPLPPMAPVPAGSDPTPDTHNPVLTGPAETGMDQAEQATS